MSSITSPYKDLKLPSVAVIQLYKKCLVLPGSDKPNYAADKTGANDGLQPAAAKKEVPRTSSDTTKEPSSAVTSKPLTAATPENIRFLGENRKGIVILVNYPDAVHMPDEHLQFITAVLNACQLNLGDVAIVNVNQYPALDWAQLKSDLTANQMMSFGIPRGKVAGLPEEEDFHLFNIESSVILNAPSIGHYMGATGKQLKALLWNRLKQMFAL